MKLDNKKCLVCGCTYSYCPNCAEYKNAPAWMNMFHDQNCHDVFEGICDYTLRKDINKAKDSLSKCDISVVKNMSERNQELVKEIMGSKAEEIVKEEYAEPVETELDIVESAVAEPIEIEEVKEATIEPIEIVEAPQTDEVAEEEKVEELESESINASSNSFKRSKKRR